MKILIVTPTLGASPWIEETAASVAAHGGEMMHVFVAPPDVVPGLSARFPSVRTMFEPGGGMYAAINAAFANVPDWDWGGYINDDDALASGFGAVVEACVDASCDIAYGDVAYVSETGRRLGRLPVADSTAVGAVLATGRAPFTQQGTLFSRGVWERLGGFDLSWRLAADCDFWCRAVLCGARFSRVRATVALFRLHSRQQSADRTRMDREIAAVHASHNVRLAPYRSVLGLMAFKAESLRCAIERRRRTGVWTSRALYMRAADLT